MVQYEDPELNGRSFVQSIPNENTIKYNEGRIRLRLRLLVT